MNFKEAMQAERAKAQVAAEKGAKPRELTQPGQYGAEQLSQTKKILNGHGRKI